MVYYTHSCYYLLLLFTININIVVLRELARARARAKSSKLPLFPRCSPSLFCEKLHTAYMADTDTT